MTDRNSNLPPVFAAIVNAGSPHVEPTTKTQAERQRLQANVEGFLDRYFVGYDPRMVMPMLPNVLVYPAKDYPNIALIIANAEEELGESICLAIYYKNENHGLGKTVFVSLEVADVNGD